MRYHYLAGRRRGKEATAAAAHSNLVAAYHVLRAGNPYRDLVRTTSTRSSVTGSRLTRYHIRRLRDLSATRSNPSRRRLPDKTTVA